MSPATPVGGPVDLAAIRDRLLDTEADWWRVRALLLQTGATTPPSWNWDIRRWDGWRFHREVPLPPAELARLMHVWEAPDGRLLGVAHPEGGGDVWLELQPHARAIEPRMLDWAEDRLAADRPDGRRQLDATVVDGDLMRGTLLADRGYLRLAGGGWTRSLPLGRWSPTADLAPPPGYAVRTTRRDDADAGRMATLLNRAFRRSTHTGLEYRMFMERSPSFDESLNLVVVAPDGSFACHIAFTIDAVNEVAILEPVATDPDHRRLGLARLLIEDGLHRVAAIGARMASVETGELPAGNALYEACGFGDARHLTVWRRTLD